ncbi:MAG: ATP-binding protein [Gammaproteobacteria bacterium]|nr:ATP-binding protein [Gammaproteobacteria bacterium]
MNSLRFFPLPYRPSRWTAIAFMMTATVFITVIGIYALYSAPALLVDGKVLTVREGIQITQIGGVPVRDTDLWKLPTFKSGTEESQWWQAQRDLHQEVEDRHAVVIRFLDSAGMSWEILVELGRMPLREIAKRLGLVYIVAVIYVFAAISVFRHHQRLTGFLCSIFLSSTALYLVGVAPVVHRPIVMDPELMRLLACVFFIASTGQIAIVHFSLVFPERKRLLRNHGWIVPTLYIYAALISTLYVSGVIGLTSSLPFLIIWLLLMMGSFVHSMLYGKDEFMRKQVRITFIAVLLVASFFVMAVVLPWPGVDNLVNNYALFSLMLPFGLILSLDNQRLYRERLALEYSARMEKERLHRELHDTVLNDLASIAIAVEGAERCPNDFEKLRAKLQQIKSNTDESSRQLRNFLWVIDDRQNTWEDIANSLRRLGYDLLGHIDVAFDLDARIADEQVRAPSPALKHAIYRAFREALINVAKHADATAVQCRLQVDERGLEITVSDDGRGMDPERVSTDRHGLINMRKRVQEQGGELRISSRPGAGTQVYMRFPVGQSRLPPNEVFTDGQPFSKLAD